MSRNDDLLGSALARWVAFSIRHGVVVVTLILAASVASTVYASRNLGLNTNTNELFSADLPFQRMIRSFEEHFPQLTDSLLIVVDGETAESVRDAADALAERLRQRGDAFTDVYFPGEEAFFEAHGLLYQSADELENFTERLATLQPLIGSLTRDPSLATLARVVRAGLERNPSDAEEVARLRSVLDHFRRAAISVYAEYPLFVPWESVLLAGTAFDPETRRVIVAVPILQYDQILAAASAMSAARSEIAALSRRDVRVRITGYPALNYEEFSGLARDTSVAGVLSFLLVVLVLWFALRTSRVVWAAAVTLLSGFAWTTAFATLFVGDLNPASVAFAVLFIGLGVDFMIHLGMHFSAAVRAGASVQEGLLRATRSTGGALVLCGVTTSIGFLAFLPTEYRGVSELGLISAGGMLVIVFQTLTLFPVLVVWWLRGSALDRLRSRRPLVLPLRPPRRPVVVCLAAAALGLVSVFLARETTLETNVIALRNPNTESVETFMDLVDSDRATPWYADLLAPDLDTAIAQAARARALPEVRRAITVADYVPADQEEKLEILADAALFMDLPPTLDPQGSEVPVETQIAALHDLVSFLGAKSLEDSAGGLARSGRLLRENLVRLLARIALDDDPETVVEALEESLLGTIPALVERLRASLETSGIRFEDLPPGLVRRMLAEDGTARVQVFPAEDLSERAAMVRFVEALRGVSTELTGLPVNLVATTYVTRDSLQEALLWALLAIAGLLLLLWGRPAETAIALAPLVLAVVLTAAATHVFDISFNFVNVCVLPLLVGIGVDSGVHMVHRAREVSVASGGLLRSTTTQAVLFSALTTVASFGTLMLSDHLGIASLGQLLVVGMVFTLGGNLLLLPALLMLRERHGSKS